MHELVFIARPLGSRIRGGVCTAEDADGIHGGAIILHGFRCRYRTAGNLRLETTIRSRRTVGEEDNDLLGIFAVRGLALGKLQAVVGTRGTGGADGVNGARECGRIRARGHSLHNLAVVVCVSIFAVRVVAHCSRFFARKLHDGNLMLLRFVGDTLVLLGNLAHEVVCRALQCVDSLRIITTTHGAIHRARSIQHQHNVERRG